MKTEELQPLTELTERLKKGRFDRTSWGPMFDTDRDVDRRRMKINTRLSTGDDPYSIKFNVEVERRLDHNNHKTTTTVNLAFSVGWFSTMQIVLKRNNDPYTFKGAEDSYGDTTFKVESLAIKNDGSYWMKPGDRDKGLAVFTLTKANKTEIKRLWMLL